MNHLPCNPTLVQQRFPPPHSLVSLQAALASLGLCSANLAFEATTAQRLSYPCFAFRAPAAEDADVTPTEAILLLAERDGRIACLRPGDAQAGTTTTAALCSLQVSRLFCNSAGAASSNQAKRMRR